MDQTVENTDETVENTDEIVENTDETADHGSTGRNLTNATASSCKTIAFI